MKKPPPTLIDGIYRHTFSKGQPRWWRSRERMRAAVQSARRFVLDERMSEFLADLAWEAFSPRSGKHRKVLVEQWRHSARLPHAATWIEFDAQAYRHRFTALMMATKWWNSDMENIRANVKHRTAMRQHDGFLEMMTILGAEDEEIRTLREGWLLRQHPQLETAFTMLLFAELNPKTGEGFKQPCITLPASYCWTSDDSMIPWPAFGDPEALVTDAPSEMFPESYDDEATPFHRTPTGHKVWASEIVTGIFKYREHRAGLMVDHDLMREAHDMDTRRQLVRAAVTYCGVLRRVWALLATINDIPMLAHAVEQAKGFIGGHQYRKFLDHKLITLHVPEERDPRKIARHVLALARRRAHQVRGHWRVDHFHRPRIGCEHDWDGDMVCKRCGGHKLWIAEHQRGDASLGFVTHDYEVKHDDNPRT